VTSERPVSTPTVRLGEEVVDLSRRIIVVGPHDDALDAQVHAAGIVDLGRASAAMLRRLPELAAGPRPVAMTFDADQLPELALAVVRGCRVVRVVDVDAAAKVCRMVEALLDAEPEGS